jgi:hypothetical protein
MFMCSDRVDHTNTTMRHSYQELSPRTAEPEHAANSQLVAAVGPDISEFQAVSVVNV